MNRRHKAILFLTMVMSGSSLLAGAIAEGLGIFILGAALAWLVGSETASRSYRYLRTVSGNLWPSLRAILVAVLAGCLLVGVAVWSNFNAFLVLVAMAIFAMLFSLLFHFPTERGWLRVVGGVIATAVFVLTTVGAAMLSGTAQQHMELIDELWVPGVIASAIGTSLLAPGWRLLLKGIGVEDPASTAQVPNPDASKSTTALYFSLCVGTIILTLCLGLLTFLSFSDSVLRRQVAGATKAPNAEDPLFFFILLTWWPFACWKRILKREPNTIPSNTKRHQRATAVLGGLFTVTLCVAITFGIQNGYDRGYGRKTTARVENDMKSLTDVAQKIGAIKSRDLQTTNDYIEAYSEIEPLEAEFDGKLQDFTEILSEVRQRTSSRGIINIQRLYANQNEWLDWDERIFGLLRERSELIKKQVLAARQMSSLPGEYQADFWRKNFRPLLEEEDALCQKIASAPESMPTWEKSEASFLNTMGSVGARLAGSVKP